MEQISSIKIVTETGSEPEEFVKGEDVDTLKYQKTASGIEIEVTGSNVDVDVMGWPWGNIRSYSITR